MENKNTLRRTFCGCKKNTKNPSSIKTLLVLMKEGVEALDERQDTHNIQT